MNSKNKIQLAGSILAVLMFITLINNAYFFLGTLQLSIWKWMAFNACSLAIIAYLICYGAFMISKKDFVLAIPLLPLYYYGTMGLFLMPWNPANLFAQITHVIITVSILWTLYVLLKKRNFEALGLGLLIAIMAFVPVFAVIQNYNQAHLSEFMQLLKGV
jgi:hypothetical protein